MTCTYVSGSGVGGQTGAGAGTQTFSNYNASGGDALWVAPSEGGGSTVTGVTFNGISLTNVVAGFGDAGSFSSLSLWVLTNAGGLGGTHNIVVSYSSGSHHLATICWLTTGTNQSTPFNTAVTGSQNANVTTSSNLTSVTGDVNGVFFDVICADNAVTAPSNFSGGQGQSQIDSGSPVTVTTLQTLVVGSKAGAASTTLGGWSWTTASHYSEFAIGINAAVSAGIPVEWITC